MKAANDDLISNVTNWLSKRCFADKYFFIGIVTSVFVAFLFIENLEAFEQGRASRDDNCVVAFAADGTNMILPRLYVFQHCAFQLSV